MAILLIDKIKQKNNGTFFLADAQDVEYNGKSIIDALKAGDIIETSSGASIHVANINVGSDTAFEASALTPGNPKAGDLVLDVNGDLYTVVKVEGTTVTPSANLKDADGGNISMKGAKGDQGEPGPTGAQGLSAYQVWLAQEGNAGKTEAEYIASLKGAKGDKGDQGEKGDKGEQGIQGVQGPAGEAFSIAKVYESVDAMNAGYATDTVKVGQFVMIDTGNVEDEDNAKLYVKGAKAYTYITDLSGATGLTGPQGQQGVQGEKGEKGDTGAKGADGAPGAKGDKGDPGAAGKDGATPTFSINENGHLIATFPD